MVILAYLIGFAAGFVVCMVLRAIFVCARPTPELPENKKLRIA